MQEKVATVLDEIATKAHYVIDILVRNLYERTADVGFLATDKELRTFVAVPQGDEYLMCYFLRDYRNKYTVYDEIILLNVDGNVLVQINDETPIEGSQDQLVSQTLNTEHYVETYRATDLRPNKDKSLIYSKRMLCPNTGEVIGVLCLCFNFAHEMVCIFDSHGDASQRSVTLLLDDNRQVIESSDDVWMPSGVKVPVNTEGCYDLVMYGGRQHFVSTFKAEGYQGYMGR